MKYIASTSTDKVYKYSKTFFAKVIIADSNNITSILSKETYTTKEEALAKAQEMVTELENQ
jgi:hypothetical protein